MSKVIFNCCKFLDHDKNHYKGCTLKNYKNMFAYFERDAVWTDNGKNPIDVQFCNKCGRLNFKTACIEGGGECSSYENEERTVETE